MTDAWDLPAEPAGHAGPAGYAGQAGSAYPAGYSSQPAQADWGRPGSTVLEADDSAGRAARRRAPQPGDRPAAPERRRPGAVSALVLTLVPLVAALVSNGQGVVFWAGALLGAAGAALLCSRPGVWWVATSTPPVVLLMSVAGVVVGDSSAQTTKLGTDMAKVVAGAFPVMGVALLCAVAVGVGRTLSARQAKGIGRG